MSHTPGPWGLEKREKCWAIKDTKGQDLAYQDDMPRVFQWSDGEVCGSVTSWGRSQQELAANARLIAAAPELLISLKDALSRLEEWIGTDCECDNTHEQNGTTCCLCQYRAAIAKATGNVR